jgi:hypothetical protein
MGIDADIQLTVNNKTLLPLTMTMAGTMGGPVDIDLKWIGNYVMGHSEMSRASFQTQGKININSELPENVIERSTAIMLVHLFQLDQDNDAAIEWYGAYTDEINHIDISYLGEEKVTVPAGTFDTYKVRLQGGAPSQIFYIEKGEHPKVVKIEVVSMPWVYYLVSSQKDR